LVADDQSEHLVGQSCGQPGELVTGPRRVGVGVDRVDLNLATTIHDNAKASGCTITA